MTDNHVTDLPADRTEDDDIPDNILDKVAALILGAPVPPPPESARQRGAA